MMTKILDVVGLSHFFWKGKLIPNIIGYDFPTWLVQVHVFEQKNAEL